MLFTKSREYHCQEHRSCCPVSCDMFDMTEFYHVMEVEVICATSGSCLKERGHVFPFLFILSAGQNAHMRSEAGSGIVEYDREGA